MDVQPASEVMCSERLNGLNKSLLEVVTNAKVFVVGTGGIGCELIKNLVLTGFNNIEVIDLDTIDVSNLNRQFLFQKRHVGKSKAKVAHESAIALCPTANIKSNHASIFNPEYNMEYFKQFDIVLNALDNRTARNHVNRLCLAARVPLVESGSSGYLGQVSVIKRGETECYECSPKPRQKTFPGCTIRNTPSELIHCVIWAKYLFNQLFGEEDADQDVSPDTADPEAAGSAGLGTTSNSEETSDGAISTEPIIDRVNTRQWAMDNDYNAEKIFAKLFRTDIEYLLSMDKLWTKREKPTPLKWMNVSNAVTSFSPYEVSTLGENIENFVNSLSELSKKMISQDDKILVWDKDDTDALNFVASAANLRGEIFSIPQKSYFEIKSMAGNIIPAIATTNAMVAGLIVMQALNILNKQFDKCRNVFISRVANPAKKLISPCVLDPPSKSCYVCVEKPEITIELNTTTCKLLDFRDQFLKKHLGMLAPDVEIQDGKGTIILSSEEGETDEALPRCLSEIGVGHGVQLRADDFLQNYDIIINILHNTDLPEEKLFQVKDQTGEMGPTEEETCIGDNEVPGPSANNNDNDIEIVEISESSSSNDVTQGKKRKMSSEKETQQDEIQQKAKRSKLCIQEVDDDIVMID